MRRRSPGPPFPPDHRQAGERGAKIGSRCLSSVTWNPKAKRGVIIREPKRNPPRWGIVRASQAVFFYPPGLSWDRTPRFPIFKVKTTKTTRSKYGRNRFEASKSSLDPLRRVRGTFGPPAPSVKKGERGLVTAISRAHCRVRRSSLEFGAMELT